MLQQLTENTIVQPYQVLHAAQMLSIKGLAHDWSLPVQDEHAEGQHRPFQVTMALKTSIQTRQEIEIILVNYREKYSR